MVRRAVKFIVEINGRRRHNKSRGFFPTQATSDFANWPGNFKHDFPRHAHVFSFLKKIHVRLLGSSTVTIFLCQTGKKYINHKKLHGLS